jgi:hypothetical protein
MLQTARHSRCILATLRSSSPVVAAFTKAARTGRKEFFLDDFIKKDKKWF